MATTNFVDNTGSIDASWLNDVDERVYGVLTPQMYGAVGNGVADDTIALENWLTALGSGSFETTIVGPRQGYLPAGKYKHTRTLTLVNNTHIRGSVRNSTLQPTSAANPALIQEGGSLIESITLDGTNTTGTVGLSIAEQGSVETIGVCRDFEAARFTGTGATAFSIADAVNWRFDNCQFWDNEDGGLLQFVSNTNPSELYFDNCTFKSNNRHGLVVQATNNTTFNHCIFELNNEFGILIKTNRSTIENLKLDSCYFEANQFSTAEGAARNALYQVYIEGAKVSIRDTYFFSSTVYAKSIDFRSAKDFVLDHNEIYNQPGQILVDAASSGWSINWPLTNGNEVGTITDTSKVLKYSQIQNNILYGAGSNNPTVSASEKAIDNAISIANTATDVSFTSISTGLICIRDGTSGASGLIWVGTSTAVLISQVTNGGTSITVTPSTANSINLSISSSTLSIENLSGGTASIRIMSFLLS